jgi:hypothetical protein
MLLQHAAATCCCNMLLLLGWTGPVGMLLAE